jgi:hypothetical protein
MLCTWNAKALNVCTEMQEIRNVFIHVSQILLCIFPKLGVKIFVYLNLIKYHALKMY